MFEAIAYYAICRTSVDEAMPKTSSSSQSRQQSSSGAKQMNDYPVYQEIASREGPQISTVRLASGAFDDFVVTVLWVREKRYRDLANERRN